MIREDDFEMMDQSLELRLRNIAGPATNSTISDFEMADNFMPIRFEAPEHCRMIPQRQANTDISRKYENKEHIFTKSVFNCFDSVNENCNYN